MHELSCGGDRTLRGLIGGVRLPDGAKSQTPGGRSDALKLQR